MATSIHLKNNSDNNYPYLELKNQYLGAKSGEIRFLKESASADNGDDLGIIKFQGYSNGNTTLTDYCQIIGEAKTTTSGSEEGQIFIKVKSGGSEIDSITINPTGIGIGNTAPGSQLEISKVSGAATLELSSWSETATESHAGKLKFLKSGTATVNTFTAGNHTTAGEILGRIEAYGVNDADSTRLSSYIEFAGDAVADADSVPGKITFATSDGDDAGTPTARMIIDDSGNVGIGTTSTLSRKVQIDLGSSANGLLLTSSASGTVDAFIGITSDSTQTGNGFRINGYDLKHSTRANQKLIFQASQSGDGTYQADLMTITGDGNVGIGTTGPKALLHCESGGTNTGPSLENMNQISTLLSNNSNQHCGLVINDSNLALSFFFAETSTPVAGSFAEKGYINGTGTSVGDIDFTGQHRSILNNNITNSSIGLIVSTNGTFVNTDNTLNPSINEALPICVVTNIDNDKKVFGVISDKEDTNSSREYPTGKFVSVYQKNNENEQRMFINSVGEGSIWVCNKNGNLENGDYITSTTVTGYGGKQTTNEGFLMNYTVAKITCDCDFSLTQIVKQKLKVTETTTDGVTTRNIDYDANGDVQYEDDLDENGAQQMVYKYETRFLQADGTQLVDEADYNTRLGNGESVYIACFVGCTYHCG